VVSKDNLARIMAVAEGCDVKEIGSENFGENELWWRGKKEEGKEMKGGKEMRGKGKGNEE
jgi:hypothetical protein